MAFVWEEAATMQLIEKLRKNELLWNPVDSDYKNKIKRAHVISNMAMEFDTTVSEIERKLKNMTSHYFREKKRHEELAKMGKPKEPKWVFYKKMNEFLRDKYQYKVQSGMVAESHQAPPASVRKRRLILNPDEDSIYFEPKQSAQEYTTRRRLNNPEVETEISIPPDQETQKSTLKVRLNKPGDESELLKAVKLLKDLTGSTATSVRDEASIFGEYVVTKLRRMDPITSSTVQNYIQNIIHQAEIGIFRQRNVLSMSPGYFTEPSAGAGSSSHFRQVAVDRNSSSFLRDGSPDVVRPSSGQSIYSGEDEKDQDTKDGLQGLFDDN